VAVDPVAERKAHTGPSESDPRRCGTLSVGPRTSPAFSSRARNLRPRTENFSRERALVASSRTRQLQNFEGWKTVGRALRDAAQASRRCVECLRPLGGRRTTYCSWPCARRFHGRFFWDTARSVVLRRDRYTCRTCGVRRRARDLEVDHIRELADGGAALDYANLQTLCPLCHRAKTRAAASLRAGGPRPSWTPDPFGPDFEPDRDRGVSWFPA
jgi:5-methylcytosine-specific restriction endonuclease McrA